MAAPESVPFDEAIAYFRQKLNLPTQTWTDIWQGMHARAFVVAGAARDALVADFREAIDKAIAQGTTLADFRKDFDQIVTRYGWRYKGGRGWRTGVIFNTNLRTAYSAGKWEQAQRLKESRPYLRYSAILDGNTRTEHRAWHGTVLPIDDGWWKTHYPPNGWGCRCTVQSLSPSDIDRLGYQVSDAAPPVQMEQRTVNTPTGPAIVTQPQGVDTGFGYNVGEAAWGRGGDVAALEKHGPWEPLTAPGIRPIKPEPLRALPPQATLGERGHSENDLREALRRAIGGDEAIFADPLGQRVIISQALVDHMLQVPARQDGRDAFFPLLPELIKNPAEIWIGFARNSSSGRVALRRRYVRLFDLGRETVVGLIVDLDGGRMSGTTFFRGVASGLQNLRSGLRIYREEK